MILFLAITLAAVSIIIVLAGVSATFGIMLAYKQFEEESNTILRTGAAASGLRITESDLSGLPEPVQRWLRYSQIIGRDKVNTVRLRQTGEFRMGEGKPWMPFHAVECFTTEPPSLIWYAEMRMGPLIRIIVKDIYINGKGGVLAKLFGLFRAAHGEGYEVDQGALLRYLNETMWFPSAALSEYIRWEPDGTDSAKATMSYGGVTAAAVFYFDREGRLVNMEADRYMTGDTGYSLERWSTPISSYGTFNGLAVPDAGEGVWKLRTGDFTYIRLRVTGIEYNGIPAEKYQSSDAHAEDNEANKP